MNYEDVKTAQDAVDFIAEHCRPQLVIETGRGWQQWKCRCCGYVWNTFPADAHGNFNFPGETHTATCAYMVATSVPHHPPEDE